VHILEIICKIVMPDNPVLITQDYTKESSV